jgi:hypothetical protein
MKLHGAGQSLGGIAKQLKMTKTSVHRNRERFEIGGRPYS